ncbi:MAG: sensor signal transduction histidine kinase [Candidatus Angelobacter sp.]|jgi:PAS domain S-box-containing protein|nr:sensor signal transduction histidine kinase [Candidatus Angelobacter sp.]
MESTAEIKRLQSCINDLISVLALPAIWSGGESSQILGTLLDVVLTMLRLDFAYARLSDASDGPPIEVVRLGDHRNSFVQPQQIGQALDRWLTCEQTASRIMVPDPAGEGEVSIASFSLGLQDEVGMLIAGSRRVDFPTEVERLLLRVAANQAGIGLQEARRSGEQKRIAEMLEQRVAERTKRLTAVNDELRRSEAYLAEAQRLSRTGSFGWRVSSGEIIWSEESFRIFQYDRTTTPTMELVLQRAHPEDAALVKQTIERASQDGKDFEHECRLLMPDGSVKHVRVVAHALSDETGSVEFVGAVMDVTLAKQAEEALRQAQADLEHVSLVTTMGELTASLAHEVNQPIAAAVTNANACLRWLTRDRPDVEEARQSASRIVKDATRAGEIISRTRLLFKKRNWKRELMDVNEVIQEMIVLLRNEATRYNVSIRTELAADLPQVMADRVQLQQVMMNLIMNSIDAMKDMEGTRELAIRSQRAEDEQLLVSVTDTGVGLPSQQTDRIFNAFFTTKPYGIGMGLRICRSIVESHDGRLWAVDNSPRGASFHFTVSTKAEAY